MPQPKLLPKAWASDGLKNDIPAARNGSLAQEAATYAEGFPGITMTPISVGGKPPSGKDMNGVLHDLSAHAVYQSQGGRYRFDAAYCAAVGGYPKGAVLMADTLDKEYISLVDGNRDNPNRSSDKWAAYAGSKATATLAGVARLIDNLTAGGRDAALSAEQGKILKNALDEKLAKQGDQTLDGAFTITGTLTAGKTEYWGKLRFNALDGGYWVIETPPAGEADKRLNIKFNSAAKKTTTLSFPDIDGGQTVAYQSWVTQQAQAVRTALKNEILGGAGAAFDTLKELQNALGGDADFAATTAERLAEAAPAGMIACFAGQTAPAGWLKANGAAVSRTAYARLFAAVGTTYGAGDGKTTFNLPDLRGEFLRGWDDARGIDTGRAFGSVQAQSVPDHYHGIGNVSSSDDGFFVNAPWKVAKTYHGRSRDLAPFPGASFAQDKVSYKTKGIYGERNTDNYGTHGGEDSRDVSTTHAVEIEGGETRPRNVALLACIKI